MVDSAPMAHDEAHCKPGSRRISAGAKGPESFLGAFRVFNVDLILGHFQVGSYRYRSLIEGLYTL